MEPKRHDCRSDTVPATKSLGLDLPVVDLAALGRISSLLKPVAIVHHLRALAGKCEALLHGLGAPDAFAGTGGPLAEGAHAIIGNAGMLGFQRLAVVARHFEDAARTDPLKAASMTDDFTAALAATIEEIRNHTAVLAGSGEGALRNARYTRIVT
jgi:HPt (histidine-containing phosphotransfer) domain-containing protein